MLKTNGMSVSSQILLREFGEHQAAIAYAEKIARNSQLSNPAMSAEYSDCVRELRSAMPA
ncbi:hypothetical protein [Azonexus hydrophilus]|uniref:Uncharacterized protein n=1 Tax=Azonexus hydrophilus TaxID=418702 RepID=A0ABZ2XKW0_9RHOO